MFWKNDGRMRRTKVNVYTVKKVTIFKGQKKACALVCKRTGHNIYKLSVYKAFKYCIFLVTMCDCCALRSW